MTTKATLIPEHTVRPSTTVPFVDLQAQYASIRGEVQEAISDVLESTQFVGGPWVERFENEFAAYLGCKYVVGVASGLQRSNWL